MSYKFQSYVPSTSVNDYKRKQDTATQNYNDYANKGYYNGAGGFGNQINSAQKKLNNLYNNNTLGQQFNYSKQKNYDKALSDISNRKAFSYDLSSDVLFQQAKEQYQAMGKTAMADTIGQASAMTGGYGNSYATTAGSQAYQSYLQELNNSIGDYYSMALATYNSETERLNGVFNAYSTDRATENSEWANNWNVYSNLYNQYYNEYSDMLGKDMEAWGQKGSNLYNAANLATGQYSTASSNDINVWNNQENLKATQAAQEETERANRAEEAYRNAQLAEQIRAAQAEEAYRDAVLRETERSNKVNEGLRQAEIDNNGKDPTVTKQSSKLTSSVITKINGEADSQRWYSADKRKDTQTIAKEIIQSEYNEKDMTVGELFYLLDYYNIDPNSVRY